MVFNEREIFIGIGIFIIIVGLVAVLITLNSSDDNSLPIQENDAKDTRGIFNKISKGVTGNVVNLITSEENYCGDGYCYIDGNGDYENCENCQQDCGECKEIDKCGNKICDIGECLICFSDCSLIQCENGVCEENKGENCVNAPNDCSCSGDSYCQNSICVSLTCGNGLCESSKGEDCQSCKQDCGACDCRVMRGSSCEIGQECNGELREGCCIGSCKWNWSYPLVFVHGHSPSEGGSMYSISTFDEFQNKLVSDGLYEERQPILANNEKIDFKENQWVDINLPVSFRTTYYFGEYSAKGGFTYDDNNQKIEEYARRLEKIIELIRYTTGRDKVDIVAHSMGGLVTREYIRQTDGKYVNKLVTIGTPNNGIYDYIATFCGTKLLGRKYTSECEDMQHNSPFLEKLNNEDVKYRNKYLTISGKAKEVNSNDALKRYLCPDGKSYHDEVVCSTSVYLDGAKNDYVFGNQVSGTDKTFHGYMVSPSKVPEVYNKVVEFLRE